MDQLQILRKLSGEKRLEVACELSDLVRELAITNIKEQLGKRATKKKILHKLRERIVKL